MKARQGAAQNCEVVATPSEMSKLVGITQQCISAPLTGTEGRKGSCNRSDTSDAMSDHMSYEISLLQV